LEAEYWIQQKIKKAREFEAKGEALHSIQIFKSLIREYPEVTEPYFLLVELFEKQNNLKAAKTIFNNVYSLHPDSNEVKLFFAQFHIRTKNWIEAITILKNLSSEEIPIVSYLIGYSYFVLKDFEIAKVHLLNFIISKEEPEVIHQAYLYLAKIEIELKQFENALKYSKKAEVLFSDYIFLWECMYIRLNRLKKL
jgi:tetratricopeptide (TPR) repeat protein